jgi:hypothetical protein
LSVLHELPQVQRSGAPAARSAGRQTRRHRLLAAAFLSCLIPLRLDMRAPRPLPHATANRAMPIIRSLQRLVAGKRVVSSRKDSASGEGHGCLRVSERVSEAHRTGPAACRRSCPAQHGLAGAGGHVVAPPISMKAPPMIPSSSGLGRADSSLRPGCGYLRWGRYPPGPSRRPAGICSGGSKNPLWCTSAPFNSVLPCRRTCLDTSLLSVRAVR